MNRLAGPDRGATWVLYRLEVQAALRDRTTVVNGILVPVLLYPLLLFVTASAISFVRGRTNDLTSRVAAFGLERHPALREEAEALAGTAFVPCPSPAAAADRVRKGTLDAVLELLPPDALGSVRARITWARSQERSAAARGRLAELLDRARDGAFRREGAARGLSGASWDLFTLEERNVATGREMGRPLLGLLLPLLFVLMVSAGCFTAAIDATAGERERSTWETLLTTAAPRASIVAAKYLAVVTFGFLSGVLNLAAMALTLRPVVSPLLARSGEQLDFALPAAGIPVLLAGALLLSGLLAAAMLLLAAFAKTFQEGQAMLTPFTLLAVLPVGCLAIPGVELTAPLALVPVVNVALVVREAVSGLFHPVPVAVAALSSVVAIAATLRLVVLVLGAEEVVTGTVQGGAAAFLARLAGRSGRAAARGKAS